MPEIDQVRHFIYCHVYVYISHSITYVLHGAAV